jgi:hypothetical protein
MTVAVGRRSGAYGADTCTTGCATGGSGGLTENAGVPITAMGAIGAAAAAATVGCAGAGGAMASFFSVSD